MAQEILDIAIAGAGPAGLATALYLQRAGHRVTVFERFDKPAPVGSGLILQPTGLTVLGDLGLLADILALGSRIDRLHGTDAASGRSVLDVRYDVSKGGRFGRCRAPRRAVRRAVSRGRGGRDRDRDAASRWRRSIPQANGQRSSPRAAASLARSTWSSTRRARARS